jgi:hypothetical protein
VKLVDDTKFLRSIHFMSNGWILGLLVGALLLGGLVGLLTTHRRRKPP